jgi:hypothetical protein
VTGTLPVANGGTGQTTATAAFDALAPTTTQGDIIYHNGTDNVRLAKGTAGQALVINSGATAPEWNTVGASASGVIWENSLVISANYTLTTAKNGFSVGPITINSGYAVTVPSGQRWVVL